MSGLQYQVSACMFCIASNTLILYNGVPHLLSNRKLAHSDFMSQHKTTNFVHLSHYVCITLELLAYKKRVQV